METAPKDARFSNPNPASHVNEALKISENSCFVDVMNESRPVVRLNILNFKLKALLDTGSHKNICGSSGTEFLEKIGFYSSRVSSHEGPFVNTADGTSHQIKRKFSVPIHFDKNFSIIEFYSAPSLPINFIVGIPFMSSFHISLTTPNSSWNPFDNERLEECQLNALEDCSFLNELDINEDVECQKELTYEQLKSLNPIIQKFEELGKILLGKTNVIAHDIDTGNNKPSFTGTRPMSPAIERKVEQEFLRFKELGVVEPAQSAYRNAMTMVERYKLGKLKLRLCLDSRKLNAITKVEKYDLPRISSILARLGKGKYFSKIDLKDAYLQIPLTERSKEKTAFFVRGHGVWQFITMPFGLVNCSATMQRLMDTLFGDLDGMVFVYQDDLIIVNEDFNEHVHTLEIVADKLLKAGLSINFAKSGFCLKSMRYMGYVVDDLGLRPDPEKISCVLKIPLPTNATELRRFLGMASWYRRFINNFAEIAAPLHELLKGSKKGKRIICNEEAIRSFESLKLSLVSAPLLQTPDFEKPFTIFCDASDACIGGVLSQFDNGDNDRPIAYVSRKLRGPELKYTTTEKECLAVVFCVNKFLEYVEGTQFTVGTDHSALTWLFKQKDVSGRLARWILSLQQHDMIIKHVRGKNNVVADAISRIPSISLLDICKPSSDDWYIRLLEKVKNGREKSNRYKIHEDELYLKISAKRNRFTNLVWKLVVPEGDRLKILEECHDDPKSAHLGVHKTVNRVSDRYYWPGLAQDVKSYVKNCQICKMSKTGNSKPYGLFGKYRRVDYPWQMLAADILGPFPRSKGGFTHLLVVCDWFTKLPCLIPLRKATAKNVVKSIESKVLHEYGIPESIVMDNGSQFSRSKEIKSMVKRYGISRLWSNCFHHPQSNFTERHNKTIGAALRSYIKDNHREWDAHIPEISIALKTAVHAVTGFSPFFLNHAREYMFHGSDHKLTRLNEPSDVIDPYTNRTNFINKFLDISEKIHEKMLKAYRRNEKHYNANREKFTFNTGDEVFLRNYCKSDASKSFAKKLAPKFTPAKIIKKYSEIAFEMESREGKPLGKWHIQDVKR